jgi:hypothetical protein
MQLRAQQMQLVLGSPATPDRQWQMLYEQSRATEAKAIATTVDSVKTALVDVARALEQVRQLVVEAARTAEAKQLLYFKLHERVAAVTGDDDARPQQQQQQWETGVQPAPATGFESSSSSSAFLGDAAAAAAAAAQRREKLLDRLVLHAATAQFMPGADFYRAVTQDLSKASASVAAALNKASSMASVLLLPSLPNSSSSSTGRSSRRAAGSSSSNSLRLVRQQTAEVLDGVSGLIALTENTMSALSEPDGPLGNLMLFGKAASLGLLACLGLWHPVPISAGSLPLSSRDARAAFQSSILRFSSEVVGASGDSSVGDSWGMDCAEMASRLLLHAAVLEMQDTTSLVDVLVHVCQQPEQGGAEGDTAAVQRWIDGGCARGRMQQLMQQQQQQHCCQTGSAAAAVVAAPAAMQPEVTGAATAAAAAAEGKVAAYEQHLSALWGLLLAVKPSVAAAVHCASLPAACRSYEAFERAVLGWPPQQADADANTNAGMGQQQDAGQQSTNSSSCSCGKPGNSYTCSPRNSHRAFTDSSTSAELRTQITDSPGSQQRIVCADAACVACELQQLAQQGPSAAGLAGEGFRLALQYICEDLVLLPAEYR